MTITKTLFLNATRCPKYITLEEKKNQLLKDDISYEEYKEQEQKNHLKEMFSNMEIEENKLEEVNKKLEAMLPFYKQVEIEAAKQVLKEFGGKVLFAEDTKDQVKFSCTKNNNQYLCYVDIYNETEEEINIIEVKATTAKKYLDLKENNYSIWKKKKNVYYLKGELKDYPLEKEMTKEKYEEKRNKLFNRFKLGEYIHDLAVQRMIIEGQLGKEKKVHYYLAVLNNYYIYDGEKEKDGTPLYKKDKRGNEIITFFQLDEVTKEKEQEIKKERENLEKWIEEKDSSFKQLGDYCGYKTEKECIYFKSECASCIPKKNSSLNYIQNRKGFKLPNKETVKGLELINRGYLHMLDIKEEWLETKNHKIQRNCVENKEEFIQKEKIEKAISTLEYPIYYLDFETFPCPLPRFKGEWPYIQSPFEFSLHIESAPGVCEKEKDNYVFLASTSKDERKKLIEELLKHVNEEKGTLFAQNVSFEKARLKELANIFEEYKEPLMKLYDKGFDLLWLINNNKELYKKLGFKKEECETINYYHENLCGSYSIKKTLPIFSQSSYQDLEVKNGTDAIVEYARYDLMSERERKRKQEALKTYCCQDTWAMVEILNGLRKKVRKEIVN